MNAYDNDFRFVVVGKISEIRKKIKDVIDRNLGKG